MNPYEPSQSQHTLSEDRGSAGHFCKWREHTIHVTAAMVPRFLPLLGQFHVSIDHGPPITSSQLRWNENFNFTITDNGRDVPATFQTYGIAFVRQPFQIHVDGMLLTDSSVHVKRSWIAFLLGICIGIAIVAICGIIFAAVLF